MTDIPCKRDCPNRTVNCHSNCKKYNDFKAEIEIVRKREQKESFTRATSFISFNRIKRRRKR